MNGEITISKGAFWLIVASVVLFNIIFLFAIVSWVNRERQAEINGMQIQEMREDVNTVSAKQDDIIKMLGNQAVRDAEIKGRDFGYRVGKTDKKEGH